MRTLLLEKRYKIVKSNLLRCVLRLEKQQQQQQKEEEEDCRNVYFLLLSSLLSEGK